MSHCLSAGREAGGAASAWLIVRSAHLTFATACPGERLRQKELNWKYGIRIWSVNVTKMGTYVHCLSNKQTQDSMNAKIYAKVVNWFLSR